MLKRTMLRAKIHRITATECDVDYEGSLSLDPELMRAAEMVPYERIDIYDIDNGNRFSTYLIEGRAGSRECCVNGAAARLVEVGDKLILAAYASISEESLRAHQPKVVLVGADNRIKEIKGSEQAGIKAISE